MPDEYIDPPIEFDEVALYQRGIDRIQAYFPNWTPRPGSMIDLILRSCGSFAAVGAEVASDVPADIFRAFGTLAHDPPNEATPGSVIATFTAQDANGYDIPSGTPVGLVVDGVTMDPVGFETLSDETIPVGLQTINVTLQASIPGANTSGLNAVVRADSLGYITGIVLQSASQGGNDAELTDDYLNRLSLDFESWTTTPIKGIEFARKARDIAGVFRAAYWENYNPVDGTTDNDKYVTVCPVDVNGNAMDSSIQTQIQNYLESLREVNFVSPVVSPVYSPIDVKGTLHVSSASLQGQAIADAIAAIQALLFPGNWGIPQTGTGQTPQWVNNPIVRLSKIVTVLESVNNVDYADTVEIGFSNPAPSAPIPTTADSGGTIPAGIYEVAVTYLNAAGETIASFISSITTLGAASTITIPSPPLPPDTAPAATGWYAYISQVGGSTLTRQQAAGSPTAIGVDLTLTAPPTNTGAEPPATNSRMGIVDLTMPGAFPLPQIGIIDIQAITP